MKEKKLTHRNECRDDYPIKMGFTPQGWFALWMEPLAATKDNASKVRIRKILTPAMRDFFAEKPVIRYPKSTIIIRHVYDRDFPISGYRDYDNVEVKFVVDLVAMYMLVDDGPLHCNVYHCCTTGNESHTEVYVLPQEEFHTWLAHDQENAFFISDTVPEQWILTVSAKRDP